MFKQDKFTAQSSGGLSGKFILPQKHAKTKKPRAKFMISRNRTIIS